LITNTGSDSVSVIDEAANTLLTTIAVGPRPIRIVANKDGTRAYVSNFGGNTLTVIDCLKLTASADIIVPP
jgi:YVTN family beta-propeller protein